jgi:orotate phosphoribosyltransferase
MLDYQRDFLDLAIANDVLHFGEFTLKSGRVSPYFFNLGRIASGAALARLGAAYATRLTAAALNVDMLFGPAYKGIALACATAIAASAQSGLDLPFAYDRKEAKDHGEGGALVGAPLAGRVLVIDDVITAGTAIRRSLALIGASGATPAGVLVALDRQERGRGDLSATQEISREYGIPVLAIAGLAELIDYAAGMPQLAGAHDHLAAYRDRYGIA